jgi:gamma-glutamyltranspeptidase / glutathione hydrolase
MPRAFFMLGLLSRRAVLVGFVVAAVVGCAPHVATLPDATAPRAAAIAMPDAFSADVAADILRSGGNAVDAAVAAAFVLAVTYPEAGNLGGGGFMLAYHDRAASFLDYRETAPAAATRDMYLDASGEVVGDPSLTGHKAAGVPGTVAGLWAAHQRYGRLPWRDLLAPAIRLAEDGFEVPPQLAERMNDSLERMQRLPGFEQYFGGMRAGVVFRQPELADTLRRIALAGPDGFYRGVTANLIVAEMRRGQGLITAADLAQYRPVWREPLRAEWQEHTVLSAPPPSSGGFAIIQLLKMKQALAEDFAGLEHNSAQYIHLVAEMQKRVFADRAEYFGDPAFVDIPIARLLADSYIAARAAEVKRDAISPVDAVRPGLEAHDTLHFSIVDHAGNAVANTYTLNTEFGSGVVVAGAGFLLNNEMDDFSIKPGTPNYFGVVGSTANEIQGGKRMLSSMSPTILLADGAVSMVVGSPGGSTIISSVFQTIVNVVQFDLPPQQAVAAPRFHHQLLPPALITFSPGAPLPDETQQALRARGYDPQPHPWEMGDVQLIWRSGDTYVPAADPRGRGAARVVP